MRSVAFLLEYPILTIPANFLYLYGQKRKPMAKEAVNNTSRLYLFRLIPDAGTSRILNEKREEQVKRRQKEWVVRQLMLKFADEQIAVVCDDAEQASALCQDICVCQAGRPRDNRLLLYRFLDGDIKQLAFCGLPDADFQPVNQTCVFIIGANSNGEQLAACLKNLLNNHCNTIFLLFHIMSADEWLVSSAVEEIDPRLMALYDVPVSDDRNPEKPEKEDDFDRVKCYSLPYKNLTATYKFMWNDGYRGVYYQVTLPDKVAEEGYRYDTTLLELLNKEFAKEKPSKKLSSHISSVFDCQDFEVIASH